MVATKTSPAFYGQHFDTLSICFSKGLGAPVGSALIGSQTTIDNALRIRKMLGGGMRQAGYLAAAAIYGIDHHWHRMQQDHDKAKSLGEVLSKVPGVRYLAPVDTNIVIFELDSELRENQFMQHMQKNKIQLISMGSGKLRFVTHLDYSDAQHDYVLKCIKQFS